MWGSLDGRVALIELGSYSDLPLSGSEPRLPALFLDRPRLYNRLDEAVDGPVAGVVAPAGWGKTLLAAGWARARRSPDRTLWLGAHVPVQRGVARAQALPGLDLVVLDDLHLLSDDEAVTRVRAFADADVSVLALSRRSLVRSVRSAVGGRVRELGGHDLAFTDEEIRAMLELSEREPTDDRVRRIRAQTEGWPAAVHQATAEEGGSARARPAQSLLDFVVAEVLGELDADEVDVALCGSIVDRLTPDLARELIGPEVDLSPLLRAGLLTADGDGHAFIPGLAACLRELIRRRCPTTHARLQAVAAQWYAAHGATPRALDHAEQSGDAALAAELLRGSWTSLALEDPARLRTLLLALPGDVRRDDRDLRLALAAAWTAVDVVAARDLLRAALAGEDDRPADPLEALRVDLVENVVSLIVTGRGGGYPAREFLAADELMDRIHDLDEEPGEALSDAITAFALVQGTTTMIVGRLDRAAEILRMGVSRASFAGLREREQVLLAHESMCSVLSGDLDRAADCLDRCREVPTSEASAASLALARALVHIERGDAALARRPLAEARKAPLEPVLGPLLLHAEAVADLLAGDYEVGWERLGSAGVDVRLSPYLAELVTGTRALLAHRVSHPDLGEPATPTTEWGRMTDAHARLQAGQHHEVRGIVETELARSAPAARRTRADLLFLGASAALEVDPAAALGFAERGLGRAEMTGGWRAVQQLPRSTLVRLLSFVEQRSESIASRTVATATRQRLGLPAPGEGERPALSRRELLVLNQLGTGRPASAIAAELYVSPNTLKTQLRSIYRKLGVGSRAEAVAVSRDLGIIR